MAHKEAFLIVIGIDEPAGDTFGPVASHLAGIRVEHVHAVDLYLYPAIFGIENVDVRFTEYDKQVALAGVLEIIGHVQVGVHAGLENGNPAELVEF